jgi:hypothetical protein
MQRNAIVELIGMTALLFSASAALALEGDDPTDIIAAQIRAQGYACDNPKGATRDPDLSQGEDSGWILDCGDATYRVKLVPDMAATVTKIDKKKQDDQDPNKN